MVLRLEHTPNLPRELVFSSALAKMGLRVCVLGMFIAMPAVIVGGAGVG